IGGRARYGFSLESAAPGELALSDILIAHPFRDSELPGDRSAPSLRPRASLMVEPDDTLGVYAEVSGLHGGRDGATHFRVELSLRRTDEPGIRRAVRWLGRVLGLAGPDAAPRVAWSGAGQDGRIEPLAVDLDLAGLDPGLYLIELAVQDLTAGQRGEARRIVRVARPD